MKTIGQEIVKLQQQKDELQQKESLQGSAIKTEMVEAYGNREQFLVTFNPSWLFSVKIDERECYTGNYPSLSQVNLSYGGNAASVFVAAYLYDLSEYSGLKDENKITEKQLEELSLIIVRGWGYLKTSEVALFFLNFKAKRYKGFYGKFNPDVITDSLRQFVSERNEALDRYESEEHWRKREEHDAKCVTHEEYLRSKTG